MAMEQVPYLVGGGFEHSEKIMRAALAAATSGAEGIMNAGEFKVKPTSVPGSNVSIAPGNALLRNTHEVGQTYACRANEETEIPIQATGSSGSRTDLIVARIDDPMYGVGEGNFDPETWEAAKFEVIQGVPANTRTAAQLNLSYPAIALARITLPASTGTVTAGMITDLRFVALPRRERVLYVHPLIQGDGDHELTATSEDGQYWPRVTTWRVDVPEWAQRVRIVGNLGGVKIRGGGGNSYGYVWVRIGGMSDPDGFNSQATAWDIPSTSAGNFREAWVFGDDHSIPAGMRGRDVTLAMRGRVNGRDSGAPRPLADSLSVLSLDLEFYETAV